MQDIQGCGSVLDQYFDQNTMSIHIKEKNPVLKKNWGPDGRKSEVWEKILDKQTVNNLIDDIFVEIESRDDGVLEIDRSLSKVIQIWPYRIVIVYPPLSDGLEITVVKPIKKLTIEDYDLDPETLDLFKNTSKWILISWAPGSGKTTFAQALVELYEKDDNIIKTIESPRDLMVPESVVQYSFTYGSHYEVRDILLLSRPDYTIYDEVRNKSDFELYKDMRLTGIGLVWVIHATRPVDSIQRFLWTIEMWIIPQVLDTVIFIDKWWIKEILQLKLTVKVPDGMESDDLARPVIQINSFLTKEVVFEIYSFGEQIVVMPLWEEIWVQKKASKLADYAKETVDQHLHNMLSCGFVSKIRWETVHLFVAKSEKWAIIWKAWKNIMAMEKSLWLRINLEVFDELPVLDIDVKVEKNQNTVVLYFPKHFINRDVYLLIDKDLIQTQTNDHGQVIVKKKSLLKIIEKKWFTLIDYDSI